MEEERVTRRSDVERVLADSRFEVPTAPAGDHGLAWLRSTASRFVNGAEHARRRALFEAELGRLDPETLRHEAQLRTDAALEASGGRIEAMADVARPIPLATLGSALGIGDGQLAGAVADAIVVGRAYLPGTAEEGVDAAVDRLRGLLDRGGSEESAAAVAVLAQACEATAALIGNAFLLATERPQLRGDVDALLQEVLLRAAPVRLMRRVSPRGEPVTLDLETAARDSRPGDRPLTFGSGLRPCPGEAQALALGAGVLEALLPRCACELGKVEWANLPALRVPERLDLVVT